MEQSHNQRLAYATVLAVADGERRKLGNASEYRRRAVVTCDRRTERKRGRGSRKRIIRNLRYRLAVYLVGYRYRVGIAEIFDEYDRRVRFGGIKPFFVFVTATAIDAHTLYSYDFTLHNTHIRFVFIGYGCIGIVAYVGGNAVECVVFYLGQRILTLVEQRYRRKFRATVKRVFAYRRNSCGNDHAFKSNAVGERVFAYRFHRRIVGIENNDARNLLVIRKRIRRYALDG